MLTNEINSLNQRFSSSLDDIQVKVEESVFDKFLFQERTTKLRQDLDKQMALFEVQNTKIDMLTSRIAQLEET